MQEQATLVNTFAGSHDMAVAGGGDRLARAPPRAP